MRKHCLPFLLAICLNIPGAAQVPFEGKISYRSGDSGYLALTATYYFSPKKIRIDFNFPVFPGEEKRQSPSQLFDLDSNILYITDPEEKLVQVVILDSLPDTEAFAKKNIPGRKMINGYECYAVETTAKQKLKTGIAEETYSFRQVSWYAKDLYTFFNTPYPQVLDGLIDNNRICLLQKTIMIMGKDTSEQQIEFIAEMIEPRKLEESIFHLPAGYEKKVITASEMLRKPDSR